jgi:hypothetical protein
MLLPDEKAAFIEAASAFIPLREKAEFIGEKQGGFQSLKDHEMAEFMGKYKRVGHVLSTIQLRTGKRPVIRFRNFIFTLPSAANVQASFESYGIQPSIWFSEDEIETIT